MNILNLKIKNFRTIATEQTIPLKDGVTIVGANNTGKTNILLATKLFFTGYENKYGYDSKIDLTFGQKRAKTSFIFTFEGDPSGDDVSLYQKLDDLHEMLGEERLSSTFNVNLYFSESSTPVYQLFPGKKLPDDKSKNAQFYAKQKTFIQELISLFSCHYIPSDKGIKDLYDELLMPFLRRAAAEALEQSSQKIIENVSNATETINKTLLNVGLGKIKTELRLPQGSLVDLISKFDLYIQDPSETSIYSKGMGLQSTTLLASLIWVTELEKKNGLKSIWLIEEPEAFLHPELSAKCSAILTELAHRSVVAITTHSLNFVPQETSKVVGTTLENGKTHVIKYDSHLEATKSIRSSLGVRFSDYFNFTHVNILVEGITDKRYLEEFYGYFSEAEQEKWPTLKKSKLTLEMGGVKELEGFLRANLNLIRTDTIIISIFDGDESGRKSISNLAGFFGEKGGFNSNIDYISLPRDVEIEGLFPQDWIQEIYTTNPGHFESYTEDINKNIVAFKIKGDKKISFQNLIFERTRSNPSGSWISKWIVLFDAIETAISTQEKKIKI